MAPRTKKVGNRCLAYRYAGRDFRLTDVFGDVVKDVLSDQNSSFSPN
jgi:hypothetical protein